MQNTQFTACAALILRLAMGVMLLAHAALKVFVFTLPGTIAFFGSLGLPPLAAWLTLFAEVFGGLGLLVGFRTRLVSVLLLPMLLGVTWAHSGNGWTFTAANGGWEYPAFLVVAAVVLALLGAGAFSWDAHNAAKSI